MTTPASRVTDARITCEDSEVGNLYYVEIAGRAPPPYTVQRHVGAILDIAADGTLAGIELIDDMPPLPSLSDSVSEASKGVRVKPLEWDEDHGVAALGPYRLYEAKTPLGKYAYGTDAEGAPYWQSPRGKIFITASEDAARRGAEASWNKSALAECSKFVSAISALDSGTGGQEPVAWERVRQAYHILNSGKPPYSDRECKASMALSRALDPTEPKAVTGGEEERRIEDLRLKAFRTNDPEDRQAYLDAVSKWFQHRHYRQIAANSIGVESDAQ